MVARCAHLVGVFMLALVVQACTAGPPPAPPTPTELAFLSKTYTRPDARCDIETAADLQRLGIDPERIERITIFEEDRGPGLFRRRALLNPLRERQSLWEDDHWIVGHRAWVQFKDCQGYLVIHYDTVCRIVQRYTQGQCQIGDIPQSWP